jgi:pre-mRNA-splicing factor CWC26
VIIDITEDKTKKGFRWKALQPVLDLPIVKIEKDDVPPPSDQGESSKQHQKLSKKKREEATVASPPKREGSPSDISPPRRRARGRHDSPDLSPPRKNARRTSDSFRPRRRSRHDSILSDISPPWKVQKETDQSDAIPQTALNSFPASSSGTITSAGLMDRTALSEEKMRAKAERERFIKSLDPLVSGPKAPTVYRDQGRKIDINQEELTEEEKAKKEREDELFNRWGRGVAQVESAENKLADELYEMSKPLARYKDDEDLERMLKERIYDDDPMLKFIKKKKSKKGSNKTPQKRKAVYNGSWPQNRFGIAPGYRWDGVNRSNGYESSRYAIQAEKFALKEVAYKWSVEDM